MIYGAGKRPAACKGRRVISISSGKSVRAKVKQVTGSREGTTFVTANLVFSNTSERIVEVTKYKILWPGGSLLLETKNLLIPPLKALERNVRINSDAGDIQKLLQEPSLARVELIETRDTP